MRPELHPVRQDVDRKCESKEILTSTEFVKYIVASLFLLEMCCFPDLLRKKTTFLEYSLLRLTDQIVSCEGKKARNG